MFDKIFYINLEHRKDRDANVIEQVKKINMLDKLVRIDAVNGKILDFDKLSYNDITEKGKRDALDKNMYVYTPLTRGGIGCALSHKKCYERIVSEKLNHVLILEDDVTISDDFEEMYNHVICKTPENYDMLFLGYHMSSLTYPYERLPFNCCISTHTRIYGLFGYVVSYYGALKLLDLFPLSHQIDTVISNNLYKLNSYIVNPEYTMIYSDPSSTKTKFGTDIQIREGFGSIYSIDTWIVVFILALMLLVIYQS